MSFPFNMADIPTDFFETATIGSTNYDCIATSALSAGSMVSEIGDAPEADIALIFKAAVPVPALGSLITFRSVQYRVSRVSPDSAGVSFTVFLIAKYGGAG